MFRHIVGLEREIGPPRYLLQKPVKDLRPLFSSNGEIGRDVLDRDILEEWPKFPSSLDNSQLDALKRILTKQLAIVQVILVPYE